ncbi:Subtilisin-like protease [Nymphaea thermarum]|nr:Subtilisin-like protease [Nymphaea thermarum]
MAFFFFSIIQVYIVYLGERQHEDPQVVASSHHDLLTVIFGSKKEASDSILYSYKHGFSGFAARLTETQARAIAELPEVVHVTPSQTHKLHTTRSWDYLGLHPGTPDSLLSTVNYGDGVIIGVIDSGIWPESQSFNDEGLGAVPSKWRGRCEEGELFNTSNCNNKIVGARFFAKGVIAKLGGVPLSLGSTGDYLSPRDANGHGTHTASTAAGSFVRNASYGGLGLGLARGGAPRARLAIYKACWTQQVVCDAADMLAALDSAIRDGVDIISVSVGTNQPPQPGYLDNLNGWSMGAFHAVARGITVVFSGGNAGPFPQKVTNGAPWIMTVAASTIDHSFPTAITLGNNRTLIVLLISCLSFSSLISCDPESLNSTLAKGKVVLCFTYAKDPSDQYSKAVDTVYQAGGAGIIFAMHTTNAFPPCSTFSCVQVDYEIGTEILAYIRATRLPKARVSRTRDTIGKVASPKVAYFSSRGPNSLSLDVLKPDIAAPGVNILAAGLNSNPYFFDSGTSMACPHVSGVAALLKSLHPHWSPAAIKSAIVTTASVTNRYGEPITAEGGPRKIADPFDFGGGHVNPNRAANPGLVYDMGVSDYVQFLCSLGYSSSAISRSSIKAPSCGSGSSVFNLNLPSITVSNLKKTTTVARTVTNVKALTFTVTFSPVREIQGDFSFGSLTWMDGKHVVRIPLVTRVVLQDSYADIS